MPRLLSAATIQARIRKLEKQAQKLEQGATKGLRAAALVIDKFGLAMPDLKTAFTMSKGRGKGRGKRGPLAGRSAPIKYRDADGNTWSGRGRPALWLVAAEKAGRKRESFLITAKSKAKPKAKKKAA